MERKCVELRRKADFLPLFESKLLSMEAVDGKARGQREGHDRWTQRTKFFRAKNGERGKNKPLSRPSVKGRRNPVEIAAMCQIGWCAANGGRSMFKFVYGLDGVPARCPVSRNKGWGGILRPFH